MRLATAKQIFVFGCNSKNFIGLISGALRRPTYLFLDKNRNGAEKKEENIQEKKKFNHS